MRKPDFEGQTAGLVLRGVVRDSVTHEGLPGATVLIKGSQIGVATKADGSFELSVPEAIAANASVVTFSSIGYVRQEIALPVSGERITVQMEASQVMLGGAIAVCRVQRSYPWHPRRFYYWTKYQLMRPFRRS